MNRFLKILLFIFLYIQVGISQTYQVQLGKPSSLDEPDWHSITTQDSLPNSKLPENISKENCKYIRVYTGKINSANYEMYILIVQKENFEELYPDRNYDLNFSNDGKPLIFSNEKDFIVLTIFNKPDSNKFILMRLSRKPKVHPEYFLDSNGDMKSKWVKVLSIQYGLTDFTGKKGTFYFDRNYILRRGVLDLGNIQYMVGLSDFNLNGLYNNKDADRLIIDLNQDRKLSFLDQTETFSLKDVFKIKNTNYRIKKIDPFGNWIEFEETKNKPTLYFITDVVETSSSKYKVDPKLWEITGKTIDGKAIALKQFKGKYILLNFWGEWCGACRKEIPLLVSENDKHSKPKLQIISFIKMFDKEKAMKMISDMGIKYPQILLSKELEKQFKIISYPTNILILPNGREGIITQGISSVFLDKNVK